MPWRLDTANPGFESEFEDFLGTKREHAADVNDTVAAILADVQARGNAAVLELTERYDGVALTSDTMRVSEAEVDAAAVQVSNEQHDALGEAYERIEAYHRRQTPTDERYVDASGTELGHRWTALDAVGLYVPGGKAAYPSSVLMTAVPARVAGVKRLAMVVPAPAGELNPLVLAAARIVGVNEIYRVGGAQAVGALAFGTESISAVNKIVGPGNAYVTAAKRQVLGIVGIDMIAGPSEILVYADAGANPDWIAADLLAQAEHDESAQSILISEDAAFAEAVVEAIEQQLETLPRAAIAAASWRNNGAVILVRNVAEAVKLIDRVAPEHLELPREDADNVAAKVRNVGAIFLGHYTPEAIGDYIAGPSHVLPTARSARYSSGLSVLDFLKRTSLVRCDPVSLRAIGGAASILADAEGLDAHAHSVRIRLG